MSYLKKFLHIFSLVQLSKCYVYSDYGNNNISLSEFYITSTYLSTFRDNMKLQRYINNCSSEIQFENDVVYTVFFQLKNSKLMDTKTNFFVYEDSNIQDYIKIENNIDVVEGFVFSKQNSSVSGYIENSSFYGKVIVDRITYYVEDLRNYPEIHKMFRNLGSNAVIFRNNLLNLYSSQSQFATENFLKSNIVDLSDRNERELFKKVIGPGKVCTLFILIDNPFLTLIHNNDLKGAVSHVLSSLEEVNAVFRSTDFDNDGFPDNIGFIIKYFVVLQTGNSPMNLLPKYTATAIDARKYLKHFSQYTLLPEVSLGIAFTGHTFTKHVLGVSYTAEPMYRNVFAFHLGGICDRPHADIPSQTSNVLVVASRLQNGLVIPQFLFNFCLAHELGHSFGSSHDDDPECMGHLMASFTPTKITRKDFTFSSCSKRTILRTIVSKGHCFQNYEEGPFCGNGIVEGNETCDCGTTWDCDTLDPCCVPRGQKGSCNVKKQDGIDCHPSQGMCCTSDCKYKNLLDYNLDCRNFEKNCPCQASKLCKCGVGGECTEDVCSSEECTRIFLAECNCPANLIQNKCKTCCLLNGSCVPSVTASEILISNNRSLLMILKLSINLNHKMKKNSGYRQFCDGSLCVDLHFRETNPDDYCLIHGQVGICNKSFICNIPTVKRIFPSFHLSQNCNSSFVPFAPMILFNAFIVFNYIFSY